MNHIHNDKFHCPYIQCHKGFSMVLKAATQPNFGLNATSNTKLYVKVHTGILDLYVIPTFQIS